MRRRLRELHGANVEITVTGTPGVSQSASPVRLNLFGAILALPALIFIGLLILVLGAGVCAFAGIFLDALFGPVAGWTGAAVTLLLVVGALRYGLTTRS